MIKKTGKKAHIHANILGVRVDSTSLDQVLGEITQKLVNEANLSKSKDKLYIVTPNPEIILLAQKDKELKKIINKADFSLPDGIGLKIFGDPTINIIHGREFMLDLCQLAAVNNLKVFLLGGSYQANIGTQRKLKKLFKNLKVSGTSGAKYSNEAEPVSQVDINTHFDTVNKINKFAPDIIFVALGAPKQEKWIDKYLPVVNARLAMTVGGTFDYLSGVTQLPPTWANKLNLEWMWRLISGGTSVERIFNAVVVFPIVSIIHKPK